MKLLPNSETYRILRHLINVGELTAVDAVKQDISANLRSRIPELRAKGFFIASKQGDGESFKRYYIPSERLEDERVKFRRAFYGS